MPMAVKLTTELHIDEDEDSSTRLSRPESLGGGANLDDGIIDVVAADGAAADTAGPLALDNSSRFCFCCCCC